MSDDFLTAEGSVQDSEPVDLYEFVNGLKIWRHTSGVRDIIWQGKLYEAIACDRSEPGINIISGATTLTVKLPPTHDIPKRWTSAGGTPPREITVKLIRLQNGVSIAEQIWSGSIDNIEFTDGTANLKIPSRFTSYVSRQMSLVSAGRMCPHVLYDTRCEVDPTAFTISVPVLYAAGRVLQVDVGDVTRKGDWFALGDITHTASGEPMLITECEEITPTSNVMELTLLAPIYELKTGDMVTIRAGCDHMALTCKNKFNNMPNFGLFPNLPDKNPMLPTGLGVSEQS